LTILPAEKFFFLFKFMESTVYLNRSEAEYLDQYQAQSQY